MTTPWGDLATYRQKKRQKFEIHLTKGVCVNPKAFCCGDNTINDAKPPVAILTATPASVYEGENVTLDLSSSYDPDGVGIADPGGYEIWDGIGGNYPATKTQVVNYANAGRYEAIGVVTDATGLKGQASVWVEVLSSNGDNPPEEPGEWCKELYVSTLVNGIYHCEDFSGPGGGNPTWSQVNTGLGANTTQCINGDPWNNGDPQYTRTAEPKIYKRSNGGSWSVILDSTIVQTVTGETIQSGLEMIGPEVNVNAEGHLYALVRFRRVSDSAYCLYFFKSTDRGDNWASVFIVGSVWDRLNPEVLRVGALQGSSPHPAGYVIYAVCIKPSAVSPEWELWVSVDQGATWANPTDLLHCRPSGMSGDLRRAVSDQDTIYWVGWGSFIGGVEYVLRKSTDRGTTWTEIWSCALTPTMTRAPGSLPYDPLSGFMPAGAAGVHYTDDDWDNYTTYTNADNFDVDRAHRQDDAPEFLYGAQANNPGGGDLQHVIAVSDDRGQNWDGKAGDDPVTPSATSIPNNCGGVSGIMRIRNE